MQRDDERRKMAGALKPTGAFTLIHEVYVSFYSSAIMPRLSRL